MPQRAFRLEHSGYFNFTMHNTFVVCRIS